MPSVEALNSATIVWVIYYADGSRLTSATCSPGDTPPIGVEVILVHDSRYGRRVLKMAEYYLWSPSLERWIEVPDAAAVVVRAMQEPVLVRAGEYLREADFEQILIRAHNDPDLPPICPGSPSHPAWRE